MLALSDRAWVMEWKELVKWVPPRLGLIPEQMPPGWVVCRVGDITQQVASRTKVSPTVEYPMVGVRWYGEGAFLRETVLGDDLSAAYVTPLVPGALIYNRLFAWKASFAVVPDDLQECFVSSEFPQFIVDKKRVLAEYLFLFFVCDATIRVVNAASVGSAAVSRNRFKEKEFADIEMPLPPLAVQRAIVDYWHTAQQEEANARHALRQVTAALDARLRAHFHARRSAALDALRSRCLVIDWRDMAAWDLQSARAAAYRHDGRDLIAMREFAEDATELAYPNREPEHEWPVYGVNNKVGVVFNQFHKGAEFNAPYKRIRKDWFFHNPTRSAVGSLGIVPEVPDDAITSPEYQVWRIKDTATDVLADYVAVLITTPLFIELVRVHRVGAVKQRLYVDNLLSIEVPRLPLEEQRRYADARRETLSRIRHAQEHMTTVRSEVSEMILGTRPIPTPPASGIT